MPHLHPGLHSQLPTAVCQTETRARTTTAHLVSQPRVGVDLKKIRLVVDHGGAFGRVAAVAGVWGGGGVHRQGDWSRGVESVGDWSRGVESVGSPLHRIEHHPHIQTSTSLNT